MIFTKIDKKNVIKNKINLEDNIDYIYSSGEEDGFDHKNRNVFNYGLNINNHHDALYQKLIFNTCNQAIKKYQKLFSSLHQEVKLESINLLKYEVGNFYKRHIDAFHMVNRQLSFIINLNEDYKGGELIFYYPHNQQPYSKIELKTGDLIMFPSFLNHSVNVNTNPSEKRYTLSFNVWVKGEIGGGHSRLTL